MMTTYRIKPLEWAADNFHCRYSAESIFGTIYANTGPGGWLLYGPSELERKIRFFDTCAEAQQCAESWYLSRLLPALEEVTNRTAE